MSVRSPVRCVQSARTQPLNDIVRCCPNGSTPYSPPPIKNLKSTSNSNSNVTESGDQNSLNEQRQKISQQILFARSQIEPLRRKATSLSNTVKNHFSDFFESQEQESIESKRYAQLETEKVGLDNDYRHIDELLSVENETKISNDISTYWDDLETLRYCIQKGHETLEEKQNCYEVIKQSEIYEEVIEQRKKIEELQHRLDNSIEEEKKINENIKKIINDSPDVIKLNQKVMFLQKRLNSILYEKSVKREELARMSNNISNRSTRRSPRAKSRRKMSSDIEEKQLIAANERDDMVFSPHISRDVTSVRSVRGPGLNNGTVSIQQPRSLKRFNSSSDVDNNSLFLTDDFDDNRMPKRGPRHAIAENCCIVNGEFYEQKGENLEQKKEEVVENQTKCNDITNTPIEKSSFGTSSLPPLQTEPENIPVPSIVMSPPRTDPQEKSPRVVRFVFEDEKSQMQ